MAEAQSGHVPWLLLGFWLPQAVQHTGVGFHSWYLKICNHSHQTLKPNTAQGNHTLVHESR